MSQFFASGSQSISVSASASVLPMNFQDWLPLGLTSWISLQSLSRVSLKSLLQHHSSKASNLWCSAFFIVLSRVFIVLSRVFIVLSQESSPTPQFKSIKSSVLSFLYSSTLTSICDYWTNHSFGSVQFSCSIVSDSLSPHGLQHARLPCPSPIPGVYSNSCPLS